MLERAPGAPDRARIEVVPELRDDAGRVRLGALATLVDVVGAGVALKHIAPDWLATADLAVSARDAIPVGPVVAEANALRSGRTTTVIEVRLRDAGSGGSDVAIATMTFVRITRPEATRGLDPSAEPDAAAPRRFSFALPGSGLTRPYTAALGVRVRDAARGELELERSDYTVNSFGSLQGGIVASLAELAGETAARAATGRPVVSTDLSIHYLSQGPQGPYRTCAEVLRSSPTLVRVEVLDVGIGERMAVAAVGAA